MTAISKKSSKTSQSDNMQADNLPSWQLQDFYDSIKSVSIREDLNKLDSQIYDFHKAYYGKIINIKPAKLYEAIKEYEEINDLSGKLSSYAYLVYSADMSNEKNAAFYQNISEKLNAMTSELLFFELEINKRGEEELNYSVMTCDKLKYYAPWIRNISVYRPYQLSDSEENILHQKTITSNDSWGRLFDETLADLRFNFDSQILTCSQILDKMSSHDASERKKAAASFGQVLQKNIKIFAYITNILAKDKSINDNLRGFKSPVSSRNLENLIEDDIVNALINSVEKQYSNLSHRYYKIKAKWLDCDKLNYWDRNAPLPNQNQKYIPWDEAVNIVLKSYNDFSPELAEIGQKFFDNNWIDADCRPGKDSGAYSHPTVPSMHPYILMNYQGKIRDVMTLAHELGHGIHQYLAREQGALMADTPLTLAETASVFGEQLTFRSLLANETDKEQKKIMIANKVEDMLNTVVRQVAFYKYEQKIHNERKNGELSIEQINQIWLSVQTASLGPAINVDDEYYKYYWAYIPHFIHSPFYVYSYAFGDCLVNALYMLYQDQPKGFVDKYIDMLSAGGTKLHKELLQPFNFDLQKTEFWDYGLSLISEFIDMLEEE